MTEPPTSQSERVATGVPGLDTLLHGGLVKGGVYMVMGMPGAGKTILANQVCFHHVRQGGRALYVTLLAETHTRMISNMRPLGFFEPSRLDESLAYLSAYSVLEEGGLDALLALLRQETKSYRASLLILDGLVAAEEIAPTERAFKKFIHGLQVITAMVGCTTLLLTTGGGKGLKAEHTMVDGLFLLRQRIYGVRAVRQLTIRKFRGSGHQHGSTPSTSPARASSSIPGWRRWWGRSSVWIRPRRAARALASQAWTPCSTGASSRAPPRCSWARPGAGSPWWGCTSSRRVPAGVISGTTSPSTIRPSACTRRPKAWAST